MSKKYEATAQQIVELVGGSENIHSLHHCQTRLRFKLFDDSKVNDEQISKLDGVLKTMNKGGMYQIVIGTSVRDCYEEVEKLISPKEGEAPAANESKKASLFDTVTDFVSSIFSPIVPALAGAGMVKALLAFLVGFSLIDKSSQTYVILNMIGDGTFAFMPVLLAYTTAQKLHCNPILGAVVAAIMCHPTWTGLVSAGEAVNFLGFIPLYLVKYTGSVIPIVLVMLVQAPLEKFLNKIVPGPVRMVFVPMIEFIVMAVLGLSVLGPLGDYLGAGLNGFFNWLANTASWLELSVLALFYQGLVVFGLHHGLAPLGSMSLSSLGYDAVFGPANICASQAQGFAAFVLGLISKDSKTKQIGLSTGFTGMMGTTEPALYGLNVPKKYPFIAGSIGACCGALYAGLTHTRRFATGSPSLFATVMYIGDGTMQYFYNILISLAITFVVTAVLTIIFYKKFDNDKKVDAE